MNRLILVMLMVFISGVLVGCKEDENGDGIIMPFKWDVENQTPKYVNIKEDGLSSIISSGKSEGHVTFTNIDGFSDFYRIGISERDYKEGNFKTLLFRSPILENGKTIGFEIWRDGDADKIVADDSPLEYSNDWCKVSIKYPIVDIEFFSCDVENDKSDIYIDFDMLLYGSRIVLTRNIF